MTYYKQLLAQYGITLKDMENVASVKEIMTRYREEFVANFLETLSQRFDLPENIETMMQETHKEYLFQWYDAFFEGKFNNDYVNFIHKSGLSHVKNRINPDMAGSMQSFVRIWMHERLFQNIDDDIARKNILLSIHKLLDATDHIQMMSYYEEELGKYSLGFSLRSFMVTISEKFSALMHLVLVGVLMLLTIGAVVFFGYDVVNMVAHGGTQHLLISALGSLLIIWVLVELLHTEIQMLRGGKFRISIIIGVALIAFIRDLLIITLKHENDMTFTMFILGSILVLGIVYLIVFWTEKSDKAKRR